MVKGGGAGVTECPLDNFNVEKTIAGFGKIKHINSSLKGESFKISTIHTYIPTSKFFFIITDRSS